MMETKQYQIRFRDIDPDTGFVSQDKLIAICETITSVNWVMNGLNLTLLEAGEPNREIYTIPCEYSGLPSPSAYEKDNLWKLNQLKNKS